MNVTPQTLKSLHEPFPEDKISWRVGRKTTDNSMGQALPYIDNRVIQASLDAIIGPENWRNEFVEVIADGKLLAVRCTLHICVEGNWIGKSDAAPVTVSKDPHSLEMALKGVYSDAMKRAAVHWGLGRYLYEYKAPWIALTKNGRLTEAPALPAHLLPADAVVREPKKIEAPANAAPAVKAVVAEAAPAVADAPAVKAVVAKAEPAAARAEQTDDTAGNEMPRDLPEAQVVLVNELIAKLEKIPAQMVRSYVEGPKGQEKLVASARKFLLKMIEAREAATATA